MQKKAIITILITTQLSSGVVYAQEKSLEAVSVTSSKMSLKTHTLRMREAKNQIGAEKYYHSELVALDPNLAFTAQVSINLITEQYESTKSAQSVIDYGLIKAPFFIAKGGLAVAGAVTSPTVGGAVIAFSAAVALDKVEDKLLEYGEEGTKKVLSDRLAAYRDKTNSNLKEEFAGLTPEQAYEKLFGEKSPVYNEALHKIIEEESGAGTGFMLKTIQDTIVRGEIRNLEIQRYTDEQLQNNAKQIVNVKKSLHEFAKKMNENVTELYQTQNEIIDEVERINERVERNTEDIQKNAKDINYIQKYMFGNMTVEQQLEALEEGMSGITDPVELASMKEKKNLELKRKSLEETASKILTGGQDLIIIAGKLGVDPNFLNDCQDIVNTGQTIFNSAQMYASGNVLGAIANASSLFGGGSRDIAGERHQEIMKAFARMDERFDEVVAGQRQILENLNLGFNQVYQNQQRILEAVHALSIKIDNNHRTVMDKLYQIHSDVLFNRKVLVDILDQDVQKCAAVLDRRSEFGYRNGAFPSFAKLEDHHFNVKTALVACLTELESKFLQLDKIDSGFLLETFNRIDERANTERFIRHIYSPSVEFLKAIATTENRSFGNVATSLFFPVVSMDFLDDKLKALGTDKIRFKNMPIEELLNSPLSVDAVYKKVDYLIELHNYFELHKDLLHGELYTLDELMNLKRTNTQGKYLLQKALVIVEAAIAQQNLISGDILVPVLAKHLQEKIESVSPPAEAGEDFLSHLSDKWGSAPDAASDLVAYNPILARNIVMYALRNGLSHHSADGMTYNLAITDQGGGEYLQSIVGSKWKLHYVSDPNVETLFGAAGEILSTEQAKAYDAEKKTVHKMPTEAGWYVFIAGSYHHLPNSLEFAQKEVRQSSELERLLRLKDRVLEEIMGYDFIERSQMDEAKLKTFNRLLMNGI